MKNTTMWLWQQHPNSEDDRRAVIVAEKGLVAEVFKLRRVGGQHWPKRGQRISDIQARVDKTLALDPLTTAETLSWAKWALNEELFSYMLELIKLKKISLPEEGSMRLPPKKELWFFVQVKSQRKYRTTILVVENATVVYAHKLFENAELPSSKFTESLSIETIRQRCQDRPEGQLWDLKQLTPEEAFKKTLGAYLRLGKGESLLQALLYYIKDNLRNEQIVSV